MNYLPVPPAASVPEVPYLVPPHLEAAFQYDGREWPTFLERKGWDKDAMYYRDTNDDDRYATSEAAAVLQSWLLFGILFESLGLSPAQDDFVSFNPEGTRIVDFRSLDGLIRAWIVRIKAASEGQRRTIRQRLDRLRDDAGAYITPTGSQIIHGRTPLPYEAVIAVLCLVSYIEIAEAHVYTELGQCLRISTPIPAAMKVFMLQKHRCPSDIQFLQANIPSLVSIYYLSLIGPADPTLRHNGCEAEKECKARLQSSTYIMRHAHSWCQCRDMASMNQNYLISTLQAQNTPLVTAVYATEGIKLLPFPYRAGIRYVAISHVWAHGLGNKPANAILACQAVAIQDMVDCLYANNARTPFWLDTLSIPAEETPSSSFRTAAIRGMKEIYAGADKVLMIDKSLLTISRNTGDLELAARIINCDWMRRIWTSQEGAKARELYIRFADGPLSVQEIVNKIDAAQRGEIFRPLATMMDQFLQPLTKLLQLGPQQSETNARNAFATALAAVQWRETEHPEDVPRLVGQLTQRPPRPICQPSPHQPPAQSRRSLIGGLLAIGIGVAATAVAQRANRQRGSSTPAAAQLEPSSRAIADTKRLLIDQGPLPAEILFQEGNKIDEAGWRWCPIGLSQRTPEGAFSNNQTCVVTTQGLRGRYFGIRIRTIPNGKLNKMFNLYNDNGNIMYIVQDLIANDQGNGSLMSSGLYESSRFGINIDGWLDSMTDPAVIISKEPVLGSTPFAMAAIVNITGHAAEQITAEYRRRAVVSFVDAATMQSYTSAAGRVGGIQALQAHMAEELRLGYSAGWKNWLVT